MNLFRKLFKSKKHSAPKSWSVTVTDEFITLTEPNLRVTQVKRNDIHTVLLVNTGKGPGLSDIWLTLVTDNIKCMIPHSAAGYDEVYAVVSKLKGFDFENAIKSMTSTAQGEFLLWTSKPPNNVYKRHK